MCDKILLSVKEICSGDCEVDAWSVHWWGITWRFDNLPLAKAFSKGRETTAWLSHVGWSLNICHRGDSEYSCSCSLRVSSHHCSTTCSSSVHFKIICPYDSERETENIQCHSLTGSLFSDSRTERPLYWDLSRMAKKCIYAYNIIFKSLELRQWTPWNCSE